MGQSYVFIHWLTIAEPDLAVTEYEKIKEKVING